MVKAENGNKVELSIIVNSQMHFIRNNGVYYSTGIVDSKFWDRYFSVFQEVYVVSRIKQYEGQELGKLSIASHRNVHFIELPEFIGPVGYLKSYFKVGKIINEAIKKNIIDCAVVRSPDPLGYRLLRYWNKTGNPYGLEIVANYADSYYYSMGLLKTIIYGALHWQTKKLAINATAVSYVTESVLQRIYPTQGKSISCSDIDLKPVDYYKRIASNCSKGKCTLIHVSTLEMDSKGHEQLLSAQKMLIEEGYAVNSVIVGGGRYKGKYELRAQELEIEEYVRFTGHIGNKDELRKELIDADIFVFPTETEGLPRVMIEAMACSLPCVASDIPTIRELIGSDWLCDQKDANSIKDKIKILIDDKAKYKTTSDMNYYTAMKYESSKLSNKRKEFFQLLLKER